MVKDSNTTFISKVKKGICSILPPNPFKIYAHKRTNINNMMKANLIAVHSSYNLKDAPKEDLPEDIKDAYGF
jgi:hypothetical protein